MSGPNDPRQGHRERLRTKFLRHGLDKFTEEEIIELLLTFGTPRRDCKQPARALLREFGSIRAVFEAEPGDLSRVDGLGPNNIVALKFIHAVSGRYLEQSLLGRDYFASSTKVHQYLKHHLESLDKEVFKVIFLDGANGVLAAEDVSRGTVGSAHVHPREIIERALVLRAAGLVFAHNHPSGKTNPSPDDFRLTRHLVHAAYLSQMRVLDHLIVGTGSNYYSFRDQGHLERYEREFDQIYQRPGS
ncbi:MAG: DNA repair protein RadC [Proteobacteria bacterium]|nr:DNA repair protein RadC [Pseudomonadota bacterium]